MMKNLIAHSRSLALLGLVAYLLAGCASTVVKKAWTAPEAGSIHFTKVFVLAMTPDDMYRRLAEIAARAQITRVPAVASFELLPDITDAQNKARVLQAIKESGADGLIVLRMISAESDIYTGGYKSLPVQYESFPDYYGYGTTYVVTGVTDTRYVYADRVFAIETNIYDVKTKKLVWSGQTLSRKSAVDDHDVGGLVTDVAQTIKAKLESQGLIP